MASTVVVNWVCSPLTIFCESECGRHRRGKIIHCLPKLAKQNRSSRSTSAFGVLLLSTNFSVLVSGVEISLLLIVFKSAVYPPPPKNVGRVCRSPKKRYFFYY